MRITILEMPNMCIMNLLWMMHVLVHLSTGTEITNKFDKTVSPLKSYLDGFIIDTVKAASRIECAKSCSTSSNCKSFMFKTDASDEGECYSTEMASAYTGTWNLTYSGTACQRWDANSPHNPYATVTNLSPAYQSSLKNYCRDLGNDKYIWCYTVDPSSRWQVCDIHRCFMANNCRLLSKVLVPDYDRPGFAYYTMENEVPCVWDNSC